MFRKTSLSLASGNAVWSSESTSSQQGKLFMCLVKHGDGVGVYAACSEVAPKKGTQVIIK
jgi:hypothetical protein